MEQCNKSRSAPERLELVRAQMAQAAREAGRDPASILLIAVSKGQGAEQILDLARAGVRDFGENYLQEWQAKRREISRSSPAMAEQLRWHYIGHLQSNKVKEVVGKAVLIHSVDSLRLAGKISQCAASLGIQQEVLWELKLAEETAKTGLSISDWRRDFSRYVDLTHLHWEGLMAIPPPTSDPAESRPYFDRLKSLLDEANRTGVLKRAMKQLSMGMSQDYAQAIAAGATMVRVGTALFGPRE